MQTERIKKLEIYIENNEYVYDAYDIDPQEMAYLGAWLITEALNGQKWKGKEE